MLQNFVLSAKSTKSTKLNRVRKFLWLQYLNVLIEFDPGVVRETGHMTSLLKCSIIWHWLFNYFFLLSKASCLTGSFVPQRWRWVRRYPFRSPYIISSISTQTGSSLVQNPTRRTMLSWLNRVMTRASAMNCPCRSEHRGNWDFAMQPAVKGARHAQRGLILEVIELFCSDVSYQDLRSRSFSKNIVPWKRSEQSGRNVEAKNSSAGA